MACNFFHSVVQQEYFIYNIKFYKVYSRYSIFSCMILTLVKNNYKLQTINLAENDVMKAKHNNYTEGYTGRRRWQNNYIALLTNELAISVGITLTFKSRHCMHVTYTCNVMHPYACKHTHARIQKHMHIHTRILSWISWGWYPWQHGSIYTAGSFDLIVSQVFSLYREGVHLW